MLEVDIVRELPGFTLNLSFEAANERVVLFGPSGAGKSMTLQAIAGMIRPDSGRIAAGHVLFDSATGVNLPPQQRRAGYVPQQYALFPHLTVGENIAFGLRGLSRTARQDRVREMLSSMALSGLEGRHPRELSGGQKQRVALARALAVRPEILLLDEPFGALDPLLRADLRDALLALDEASNLTCVIVTHDLADAFLLGEKVVVLDEGRVLQAGSREDIFYRPATRRVAELVATRNILAGTVVPGSDGFTCLRWNGAVLMAATHAPLPPGSRAHICIRPTQIMIRSRESAEVEERPNLLSGVIVDEIIGAETYRLFVRLRQSQEDYDLQVELPGYVYFRLELDQRKEIQLSVRPEVVHIIPVQD